MTVFLIYKCFLGALNFMFLSICILGIISGQMTREEVGAMSALSILLLMNNMYIVLEAFL